MEIWEILDENGNKTGRTIERGNKIPEGFYHLGTDVWIINSKNQILIQKRSANKKSDPNVWAMTGGSVVIGENSFEAIQRETYEEIGIKLNPNNLKLVSKLKIGNSFIDTYFTKQDIELKDVIMQESEVSDVKWATFGEIDNLYNNGNFMKNRWQYIRELIKEYINN